MGGWELSIMLLGEFNVGRSSRVTIYFLWLVLLIRMSSCSEVGSSAAKA